MSQLPLFDAAHANPNSIAIIDESGSYTFRQLLDRSAALAGRLLNGRRDLEERRVGFLVPPGFNYVVVQWAIWRAGGVAVPLGLNHPPPELRYVIEDADVSTVVAAEGESASVAEIAGELELPLFGVGDVSESADVELPVVDPARRAMILYTSGSTGKPKGVVTTHANIQAQVDSLVEAWQWRTSDHILHVLPLHHIHGIINVLCCAMRVGATCEFMPKFDADRVWSRFVRGGLSLFMAVPTIYARLIAAWDEANADQQAAMSAGMNSMRLMVSGSAALPIPTLEKWEQISGHRLLERYGMTEIGMALSNPFEGERRPGFVGTPLPGVEVQRTDDAGQLLADEIAGEIEVRGPNVFQEYWQRPEATAESFRDGWFRTGDVAVVERGCYRILGRQSVDIIKTGGYKVSALEIEDVLRTHPDIRDCAVVGVPDDQWGERVAVCAVVAKDTSLSLDDLRDWAKQNLATYKVPSLLVTRDKLPRNAMGKVQKPEVRTMFEQH